MIPLFVLLVAAKLLIPTIPTAVVLAPLAVLLTYWLALLTLAFWVWFNEGI